MTEEAQSPAAVAEAPQGTAPTEAPAAPEPQASAPAAAPAPAATEPDYEALLSKEEVLERLLQHPKAQQRLKSVRDADVQRRAEEIAGAQLAGFRQQQALEAQLAADRELLKLANEEADVSPTAQRVKAQLEEKIRTTEAQKVRTEREQEKLAAQADAYRTTTNAMLAYLQKSGLSAEEIGGLNPSHFADKGPDAWWDAVLEAAAEKKAAAKLKTILPKEKEAIRAELAGEKRATEAAPPKLPEGGGVPSDSDFLAAFANGTNSDFAQAKRLLGL